MKKSILRMLAIAFMAALSVGFVSCGDDEEESPENNLPDKSKAFIGYWRNSQTGQTNSCDFVFYEDGTCDRYLTSEGSYKDSGIWTFNPETNILATTVGGWQWQITLSSSSSWAGVSLGNSTTQSYDRDDERYIIASLRETTWECESSYMSFSLVSYKYSSPGINSDYIRVRTNKYSISSDSWFEMIFNDIEVNNATISCSYRIYKCYYTYWGDLTRMDRPTVSGKIVIEKNHSKNAKMIISNGTSSEEYKIKQ